MVQILNWPNSAFDIMGSYALTQAGKCNIVMVMDMMLRWVEGKAVCGWVVVWTLIPIICYLEDDMPLLGVSRGIADNGSVKPLTSYKWKQIPHI